jgi:hypothetical protein
VLRQLNDLGLDVVAIDRAPTRGAPRSPRTWRAADRRRRVRDEILRAASIDTCRALLVLSTDDAVNLQAALHARAARRKSGWCCGCSTTTSPAGSSDAFNINISRSVSRLCAPVFAASMLDREVLGHDPGRPARGAGRDRAGAGRVRIGRCAAEQRRPPESARVISMRAAGEEWVDWAPDPARVLAAGDEVVVVARRGGLRVLLEQATPWARDS